MSEDVPQISSSPTSLINDGSTNSTVLSDSTPCYDSGEIISQNSNIISNNSDQRINNIVPNADAVPTPPLSEEPESYSMDLEALEHEIGLPGVEMLSGGGEQQFIKRPLNAYMIFTRLERKKIMAQDPKKKMFEVSREMGERWKALSDPQKKPFFDLAKKHKELHQTYLKANPEIAYHPQRKKTSKTSGGNKAQHQPPATPDYNGVPGKTISPVTHVMQQPQQQYQPHMNGGSMQQNGLQPNNNNNIYGSQGNGQMHQQQQPPAGICNNSNFYMQAPQHIAQGLQPMGMMPQNNQNNEMMIGYYNSQFMPGQMIDNGQMPNNGYYFDNNMYTTVHHSNGTG